MRRWTVNKTLGALSIGEPLRSQKLEGGAVVGSEQGSLDLEDSVAIAE